MTKNEAIKRLEAIKGVAMTYGNKLWKLKNYSIDDVQERCYMHTEQGKQFDRPYDGLDEFLEQLEPLKESELTPTPAYSMKELVKKELPPFEILPQNNDAPKTFSDLRGILMNNIENLRNGKIKVDVAKEICSHAQTVVNITKLELEYFKKAR